MPYTYHHRPAHWARYGTAFLVTILALSLTLVVPALRDHAMFMLVVSAVSLSAWYGGLGPAILSIVLAGWGSAYLLLPSLYSLDFPNWESLAGLVSFLIVALLISTLNATSRRAQDKIVRVLESITDGFIILDSKWNYVHLNDQAATLLRKTRKQLIGKNVWEEFPEVVNSTFYTECHRATTENIPVHFEYFYPPFEQWFEFHAHPSAEGLTLYLADITVSKRASLMILKYNEELEQRVKDRTRELEVANAALIRQVAEHTQTEASLRNSEERFRSLAESANDAIVSADSNGLILSWNRSAETIFGYPEKEVIGMPLTLLMPHRYRKAHQDGMQRMRQGGESRVVGKTVELHGLKKDGTEFALELSLAAWKIGDSRYFSGIIRDITARKQAEDELARFRVMVSGVVDYAMLMLDTGGRIVSWNAGAERLKGYQAGEIIGRHFSCFYPPEDIQRGKPEHELHIATAEGRVEDLGWRVRKDGSRFWANVVITAMRDETGQLCGFSKVARDLTERKQAAEELERFRLMVEGVVDYAILMLDTGGRVVSWNAGAERLKGYQTGEIIGRHFSCFYPPEDIQRGKPEHQLHIATAEGRVEDLGWRVRKDGSRFWANVVITAMRDETGQLCGFSKVSRDLTERKQAEESLAQRVQELACSNAELQRFAYVASHDLQEPLRMVTSYTQLLASRYNAKLGPEADYFMNYIVDGARRMERLIHDILEYSLFDANKKAPKSIDCEEVLTIALQNLQTTIQESGATITHDKLPTIRAISTQLVQVFQNLIGNAIKFSKEAPRIHVSAECSAEVPGNPEHWVFSVRDNGIGIPHDDSDQIFEVFRRLHPRHEYPGTGIGLASCKKVIEGHSGRIWVKSQQGRGSTFFFSIPSKGNGHDHT